MTWNGRLSRISPRIGPGLAVFLIMSVLPTLVWPVPAKAARIGRFLTAEDIAGRTVLDQNGEPVQLPTAADRHPSLTKGSTPTYLAIPLLGGEHLPASIPTLETGSQLGETPVGPLNFDALVKLNLDATLAKSKLAVVDTPSQNYLVEFLPRRKGSTSLSTAAVNDITHLFNSGTNQLTKLTQGGMTDLEKFLHISSKSSTSTPSLNLEAQLISSEVLPTPAPEPSTWMIFIGLLVGGAVFRSRMTTTVDA